MEDENLLRQEEEFEALEAFYGEDIEEGGQLVGEGIRCWRVQLGPPRCVLEVHLSKNYPCLEAPKPVLQVPPWILYETRSDQLVQELLEMFTPDMEVVILWAEHCRTALEDYKDNANKPQQQQQQSEEVAPVVVLHDRIDTEQNDSECRVFTPATSKFHQPMRQFPKREIEGDENRVDIFRGQPFHPPRSGPSELMLAHVARVTSMGQVHWFMAQLLFQDKKVACVFYKRT